MIEINYTYSWMSRFKTVVGSWVREPQPKVMKRAPAVVLVRLGCVRDAEAGEGPFLGVADTHLVGIPEISENWL